MCLCAACLLACLLYLGLNSGEDEDVELLLLLLLVLLLLILVWMSSLLFVGVGCEESVAEGKHHGVPKHHDVRLILR